MYTSGGGYGVLKIKYTTHNTKTKQERSRKLFVPRFVRWFFVRSAQIYEAYMECTSIKFELFWRKISRKDGCKGVSETAHLLCKDFGTLITNLPLKFSSAIGSGTSISFSSITSICPSIASVRLGFNSSSVSPVLFYCMVNSYSIPIFSY